MVRAYSVDCLSHLHIKVILRTSIKDVVYGATLRYVFYAFAVRMVKNKFKMRNIVFFVMAFSFVSTLNAQDIITLKDGSDIQAKILEINASEIKYKKYSNPDGPIYTIQKNDVLIVQYENGEKDVFSYNQHTSNTKEKIYEGMKYNEYRKFYDTKNYISQPTDPYSRGWAGVASAFIPGLGQGVAGEWGRGALFFLGNIGINALLYTQRLEYTQYSNLTYTYQTYYEYTNLYWVILAVGIAYDIWSICDAVHVAKIKNMYHQDIRGQKTAMIECSVSPLLTITPNVGNNNQPITGLSFKILF